MSFSYTPELTQNALTVLEKRYLIKDDSGKVIETPRELFERVARNIARAEKLFNKDADENYFAAIFYDEMAKLKFLPNTPTLRNAGSALQQLSACFVLPVGDSIEDIFEAVKYTALIHKSGGGTGFSFSRLRPKDDLVQATKGVSSGPVSFMEVFDAATESVKQGGARRGANMGILRVDHPDILEFIRAKKDKSKLTNFNISVGLTEKFMEAVRSGARYTLFNPRTGNTAGELIARDVYAEIAQLAWEGGDPGIVFLDRINRGNPTPKDGEIESTNPCGEQPLLPYESCNLGSINLLRFVTGKQVDWDALKNTIHIAVRFLDNVIEMNEYPIERIALMSKKNRKIGLGLMGWADMLASLEIPYNSDMAISFAEKLMKFIQEEGRNSSVALAKERGSFPNFNNSVFPDQGFTHMRNATITTIAPTGTISIIAGVSGGIEPYFALAFYRNVMDKEKLVEVNPIFLKVAKEEGFYSADLEDELAEKGCLHNIESVPEKWKRSFVTAHEMAPTWHVRMQAAFQKYTDNAVSKTVNFTKNATVEDVRTVYNLAYDMNCKGITIYRDGSRSSQVLNVGSKEKEDKEREKALAQGFLKIRPRPRPKICVGRTQEMETSCGKMYVTVNQDDTGRIFEVLTHIGKAGGCANSQSEAIGRMISLSLRSGIELEPILQQLEGISCSIKRGFGKDAVLSCADAVAKGIKKALAAPMTLNVTKQMTLEEFLQDDEPADYTPGNGACPECGGHMEYAEGCSKCSVCGYSQCD